ncbi:MAG: hypothetical protein IAG13_31930 [Deltaproteobacteria bacterium]|nr:hypothetical protein [Nannocystaceae bacterium]
MLGSHTSTAADACSLPARWSTLPGPHHVKIAGLLEHAHAGSVPTPLLDRARATLRHWRTAAEAGALTGELHPLLYFLEGLVIDAVARETVPPWALIRGVLGQVMSASTPQGDLPEQLSHAGGTRRSDIAAQALRLCVLASTGSAAQDGGGSGTALRERAARLCGALTSRYIGPGGAVHSFPLHGPGAPNGPNPPNVWAAIFTYQALRYHAYLLGGERVPMSMVSTLA